MGDPGVGEVTGIGAGWIVGGRLVVVAWGRRIGEGGCVGTMGGVK